MNTRSLKFRLSVWYAAWLTLAFTGVAAFVYIGLSHFLERDLTVGVDQTELRPPHHVGHHVEGPRNVLVEHPRARVNRPRRRHRNAEPFGSQN